MTQSITLEFDLQAYTLPEGADGTDGERIIRFISQFCRHTTGRLEGQRIVLLHFQKQLLVDIFATAGGVRLYRRGLVGMPRKNGKSALGAGIALFALVADGEAGAQVYSCAGDREQAKIVFLEACRMVELDEEFGDGSLSRVCKVRKAANIIYGPRGSRYRALSAEAYTKEGLNPSCVIFDEVHVQPNSELWTVMTLGSAARERPLILGITTAGYDAESMCGKLYALGRCGAPGFYFKWYEAPADADHEDPAVWRQCNPGMVGSAHLAPGEQGFLTEAAIRDELYGSEATSENAFRRYRLNQWTASVETWLPFGMWDGLAADRQLQPGDQVCLALDGSFNGDVTALVACTPAGHLQVIGAWARPAGPAAADWKVPIDEVEQAIRQACMDYRVDEVPYDPYRWERSAQVLESEGIPMVRYPQTDARMIPATTKFYDGCHAGTVSHDGDPRLAQHVANAYVKAGQAGPRLRKEHKKSSKHIDLAVAAVMAHDRATQVAVDDGPSIW